jgi:hypothetical protein
LKPTSIVLATTLVALASLPAAAETLVIDLAGWEASGDFGEPGNTSAFFSLPSGSTVTGFDYAGLLFTAFSPSWRNELVISVNDNTGAPAVIENFMDWAPSGEPSAGEAGPLVGSWRGAAGAEGPYGAGASFTVGAGGNNLWVTVYDGVPDAVSPNVRITAGTLTIRYTPAIPEPSAYALMALGLLGIAAARHLRAGREN